MTRQTEGNNLIAEPERKKHSKGDHRPMLLPIVQYNEAILRKKGERVVDFDAELARLAGNLVETMHEARGIGLAAQQIGRALQVCAVDLREARSEFDWQLDGKRPPKELIMPIVLVNPEVTPVPWPTAIAEEGCLSFPNIHGDIERPDRITVEFQDAEGHGHTLTCTGLLSRCIQHEVDHLNGILYIDRMEKTSLEKIGPALKELKKRTRAALKKAV